MIKGEKGGECNRTACKNKPADHFNDSTRRWYCAPCAKQINYWSIKDDGIIICRKVD